jgi:hypothetical protein
LTHTAVEVSQQRNGVLETFRCRMAGHGGAADADGGHRGRNRHGVIPGLGYLAADE